MLVELMINQEGIHRLLVKSLSSSKDLGQGNIMSEEMSFLRHSGNLLKFDKHTIL